MWNSFIQSYKIKMTYIANSFIFMLKSIPIIKKLLPYSLYSSSGLKTLAYIYGVINELLGFFLGKLIYILTLFVLVGEFTEINSISYFINVLFFLTLIGGIIKSEIFEPSIDKYYAIVLLRMDAAKYVLSNYVYFLFKTFAGFLPILFITGLIYGMNILTLLAMPIYIVSVKLIFCCIILLMRDSKKIPERLRGTIKYLSIIVLFFLAYYLPLNDVGLDQRPFCIITVICLLTGIISTVYIFTYKKYTYMCKILLRNSIDSPEDTVKEAKLKSMENNISSSNKVTSSKSGFKYFNELFMKRHTSILYRFAIIVTIVESIIFSICTVCVVLLPDAKSDFSNMFLKNLPVFLLVMYLINSGRNVTRAMFMNCDHSMLTYRFYRQSKNILALFWERLKFLIRINQIPAFVLSVELLILMFLTGCTDNIINYIVVFVSINTMSIFFSVHYLVMYYLLQPYDINIESKSPAYGIVNYITYFVCYAIIRIEIPTLIFGGVLIIFCIVYICISLLLAYILAPKTFKLRR